MSEKHSTEKNPRTGEVTHVGWTAYLIEPLFNQIATPKLF